MRSRILAPFLLVVLAVALIACQPADTGEEATPAAAPADATADAASPAAADSGAVDVLVQDYSFTAPARLPSGWNTFRFRNEGEEPHFLVLWRLPEDKTFDDFAAEIVPAFMSAVEPYRAGEVDREGMVELLGGALPEWFLTSVDGWGGPGFTSPGRTSQTTLQLEPGEYVMECYAQSAEGEFHGKLGMLRPLTVTDEMSGLSVPEADIELTLSNYQIDVEGDLTPGEHTVAVHVAEEPEGLLGHDVHLARLAEDTDLDEAVTWMDWVDSMRAPAPMEFLGGAEEMPAGHTAYFTVTLEPGRYAWVSEGYFAEGMVKEFRVSEGS